MSKNKIVKSVQLILLKFFTRHCNWYNIRIILANLGDTYYVLYGINFRCTYISLEIFVIPRGLLKFH